MLKKIKSNGNLYGWGGFHAFVAAFMFAAWFLIPFGPVEGTGMHTEFVQGMVATIEGGALIQVTSPTPFTIGYQSDGNLVEFNAPSVNGDYIYETSTSQTTITTEIYMLKSSGGFSTPEIKVESSGDQYPKLTVSRTWEDPLLQLLKWYLFIPFVLNVLLSVLLIYGAFTFPW